MKAQEEGRRKRKCISIKAQTFDKLKTSDNSHLESVT